MHELAIMDNLMSVLNEQIQVHNLKKVSKVQLVIGELTGVVPDAMRFCWEVCTEKTPCEGAELIIMPMPAVALCSGCSSEFPFKRDSDYCCPQCGEAVREMLSGKELYIDYIDGD